MAHAAQRVRQGWVAGRVEVVPVVVLTVVLVAAAVPLAARAVVILPYLPLCVRDGDIPPASDSGLSPGRLHRPGQPAVRPGAAGGIMAV